MLNWAVHLVLLIEVWCCTLENDYIQEGDTSIADDLSKKVRVLCWIITNPANHQSKAMDIKNTWGPRCNYLLFMSSALDPSLPTVNVTVYQEENGNVTLSKNMNAAFNYVFDNHLEDVDWFLKVDDDAFLIVENLRYMLAKYDPNRPLYFGTQLPRHKMEIEKDNANDRAGFVLSRAGLAQFVQNGLRGHKCKSLRAKHEDIKMAICLELSGVTKMETRDSLQRERFFNKITPAEMIPHKFKFSDYSETAILFQKLTKSEIYTMYYFLYKFEPYGTITSWSALKRK